MKHPVDECADAHTALTVLGAIETLLETDHSFDVVTQRWAARTINSLQAQSQRQLKRYDKARVRSKAALANKENAE